MLDSSDTEAACDVDRLQAWVRTELGCRSAVTVVGRASGGSSNITLFVDAGPDEHWVLRRPPLGDVLPTAHDVAREYRYVAAVHRAGLPVPEPIGFCADPSVIGAPFSIFRRVAGLAMADPASRCLADPASANSVTRSMVETLASIHSLDWRALGLEPRPGSFLERQVLRWRRQLELTSTAARHGSRLDDITRWVEANVPPTTRQAIVHGDFTLNNVLVSAPPDSAVAAVLDWEMATIGDPATDVVWMVRGWGLVTQTSNWITNVSGALTADEAIAAYEDAAGLPIANREFYEVFCAWKGIAILEGLHARWQAGTAADPRANTFGPMAVDAVASLHARISCQH